MKKILFLSFALILGCTLFAQNNRAEQRGQHEKRQNMSPEEIAKKQTDALSNSLNLDSVQYQALFIINYSDALDAKERMKQRVGEKEKKAERPKMTEEQRQARQKEIKEREESRNEKFKKILTTAQYEKYIKQQKERGNNRQHRNGTKRS